MPCCAFAAAIVGQLILGLAAMKRTLFGGQDASKERNEAVEWRLDSPSIPAGEVAPRRIRGFGVRGLAVAAVVELLIVLGAVYGVAGHFRHGGHAGHEHGNPSTSAHE